MADLEFPSSASQVRDYECETCIDFGFYFQTESIGALKASVLSGCRRCALLHDAIQSYTPGLDDSTQFTVHKSPSFLEIIYTDDPAGGVPPEDTCRLIRLTVFVKCSVDDTSYVVHPLLASEIPSISGDTASPRANQLAQEWHSKCLLEHKSCMISTVNELPTRVLDLQSFEGSNDIRLYDSNGKEGTYCTLSHCWGQVPVIKLTKSTLATYKERIHFDWLPRTFQDAVTFTRTLSVRYLWIDSLCIIQDTDEWDSEASKMATVYSGSHLTIAASKGSNAEDGLFSAVGSEHALRQLKFTNENGESTEVFVRHKISHLDAKQSFPLLSRAWALQERILSPRVLHFGPQELLWECMETRQCECTFVNKPSMSDLMAKAKKDYSCLFDNSCPSSHGPDLWRSIVSQYSQLKLTYSDDIFSALAGLAQRSMPLIGANYIAGLWMDHSLPGYLLWRIPPHILIAYVTDYNRLQPRLAPARAPTWSWASIQSPVEFPDYYGFWSPWNRLGCEYSLVNQFTGLPRGSLTVTTQLVPVTLRRTGRIRKFEDGISPFAEDKEIYGPFKYEIALLMDGEEINSLSCRLDYDIWEKDVNEVHDGATLFCAVVGYSWTKRDYPGGVARKTCHSDGTFVKATLHCLILRGRNTFILHGRNTSDSVRSVHCEALEQKEQEEHEHKELHPGDETSAAISQELKTLEIHDDTLHALSSTNSKEIQIMTNAQEQDTSSNEADELGDTCVQDVADSQEHESEAADAEESSKESSKEESEEDAVFERIGVAELPPSMTGDFQAFLRTCLDAPFFDIQIA